jgi:hypothetical protein
MNLVRRHRSPHAASAHEHTPFCLTPNDRLTNRSRKIRVVRRSIIHRAAVDDLVPQFPCILDQERFESKPRVIASEGYFHEKFPFVLQRLMRPQQRRLIDNGRRLVYLM